jgi:hypothetical protein
MSPLFEGLLGSEYREANAGRGPTTNWLSGFRATCRVNISNYMYLKIGKVRE